MRVGGGMKQRFTLMLVFLSACAPIPMYNRLSPYPAQGQSQSQLVADSNTCEAFGSQQQQVVGTAGNAAVGTVAGAAMGAGSGALAGALWGNTGEGAAAGAAVGAVLGLVQGMAAAGNARDQIRVVAYRNCMIARGYVLP
jgi:hypothetical protein